MGKYTEDTTNYVIRKYIDDKGWCVGHKQVGILENDFIPIEWLETKGMQLVSNDVRPEIFKLIKAYQKESEGKNEQ